MVLKAGTTQRHIPLIMRIGILIKVKIIFLTQKMRDLTSNSRMVDLFITIAEAPEEQLHLVELDVIVMRKEEAEEACHKGCLSIIR